MSKKKVKRLKSIANLKTQFLSSQDIIKVSGIRNKISFSEIETLFGWLYSKPYIYKQLYPSSFPKTFIELEPNQFLKPKDAEFEIKWSALRLSYYTSYLQNFIDLKQNFESALLKSNFNECNRILNEVNDRFGKSFWLISNKIALLQLEQGLEQQKKYLKSIFDKSLSGGYVNYISYFLSLKNELTTIPRHFHTRVEKHTKIIRVSEDLKLFANFLLLPTNVYTDKEISAPLLHCGNCSIIDGYESLILLGRVIINSEINSLFPTLKLEIERLASQLKDSNLQTILLLLNSNQELTFEQSEDASKAFEYFLVGEFDKLSELIDSTIRSKPEIFDVWEIAAKANIYGNFLTNKNDSSFDTSTPNNSLAIKLISYLSNIFHNDFNSDNFHTEVLKTAFNFNTLNWSLAVVGLLYKELYSEPNYGADANCRFGGMFQNNVHPLRLFNLTKKNQLKYFELIRQKNGSSLLNQYSEAIVFPEKGVGNLQERIKTSELNLLQSELSYAEQNYNDCIDYANHLISSNEGYYNRKGIRLKSNSLFNTDLTECIRFTVKALIENPKIITLVPLRDIVETINDDHRELLKDDISLPIIYNLYSEYYDDSFDAIRNDAYEDFLSENNINRPSKLQEINHNFGNLELVYFLQNIAIESIMDRSLVFDGTNDIANERLKVCQILIDLDPVNTDLYQNEIISINQRLLLQKRIREVEQSRIHVDLENLKKKISADVKESFNRHLAFLREKIDPVTLKYKSPKIRPVEKVKDVIEKVGDIYHLIGLPEDEMSQIFESIFLKVRDEYVSNVPYGLDAFLSVRIRHGTLGSQLRNTLEEFNLVTAKNYKTGDYKKNEYWLDHISDQSPNDGSGKKLERGLKELDKVLTSFSAEFDKLISEIVSNWIQVKKLPNEKGEFNFYFERLIIQLISNRFNEETSFDEFLDKLLNIFEVRLTSNLIKIREKFSNECKERLQEIFNKLQTNVDSIGKDFSIDMGDLSYSITSARTSISISVDRIIKWFTLSKSTAKEPFLVTEAIEISENSVRTLVNNFKVKVFGPPPSIYIDGKHLNGFVDIFFILFENIVRHSENDHPPIAEIFIGFTNENLNILIENEINQNLEFDRIEIKLQQIKSRINKGEYMTGVAKEGGSGFYKIFNIINYSFNVNAKLEFGVKHSGKFFVSFELPIRSIGVKNETINC